MTWGFSVWAVVQMRDSGAWQEIAAFAVAYLTGSPMVAEFTETEQCLLGCGENLVGCSSLHRRGGQGLARQDRADREAEAGPSSAHRG